MEKAFHRAFARAQALQPDNDDYATAKPAGGGHGHGGSSAAGQRQEETPLPAAQRILKCWDAKDYFGLLGLPEPEADELGRPVWSCSEVEVGKAYRKLSIAVHPDKNPGDEEARKAFEALNKAHRMLKDTSSREEVMREVADKLRRRRDQQEAKGGLGERVALHAAKNARARELRKGEGQGLQAAILEQMKKRQEDAKRRAEVAQRARCSRDQGGDAGSSSDDEGRGDARPAGTSARGGVQPQAGHSHGHGHGRGGGGAAAPAAAAAGGRSGSDGQQQRGKGRPRGGDSDSDDDAAAAAAATRRRKRPAFM